MNNQSIEKVNLHIIWSWMSPSVAARNILVNPSILHSTLWVKSTQHALMSSVIFTPQSGLNWNLVARLGRFVPFKVTANLFPLSDKWSCKPFPVPFPCAFLINTAWRSVLIFASVCRQVATFNSRGRKTKHPHNQLSKENLGQPSEIQFRNTLSSKYDKQVCNRKSSVYIAVGSCKSVCFPAVCQTGSFIYPKIQSEYNSCSLY